MRSSEYYHDYYLKNREKLRKNRKIYYLKSKEKINAKQREKRIKDKELNKQICNMDCFNCIYDDCILK